MFCLHLFQSLFLLRALLLRILFLLSKPLIQLPYALIHLFSNVSLKAVQSRHEFLGYLIPNVLQAYRESLGTLILTCVRGLLVPWVCLSKSLDNS